MAFALEQASCEICRELRARSELPIIVLSARGLEDDLVAAVQ